jgi:hypothetical protein
MTILNRFMRWLLRDNQTLADLPIPWGRKDFLGESLYWDLDRLPFGFAFTGGTGVGKSRRLLLPLLARLLRLRFYQNKETAWAALILDPKSTFISALLSMEAPYGNFFITLGESCCYAINILRSTVPSTRLAELLSESRFAGEKMSKSSGSAWYESNAITVLGILIELARLSQQKCLQTVFEMLSVLLRGGDVESPNPEAEPALQRLRELLSGDPKEVRMILSSVEHILQPFREVPWKQIFAKDGEYFFQTARDNGAIMLARFSPNTPCLNSGLYLMKAMWFETIMERLEPNFRGNTTRLCLYVCDEFQKVARPGSESAFFDVRREAKGVPIVAFQQLSQLVDVLGPTETETVLGLLSTKIAPRNPDPTTNDYYSRLGGEIDVLTESTTTSLGHSDLSRAGSSITETRQRMPRIPAQFFFDLPDGDVVVFEAGKKPYCAWFHDAFLSAKEEKTWRKKHWPSRPNLSKPPRFLR